MPEEAKVVLVTGSSSGIGAATVRLFAKQGYKVAISGSREAKVEKVVSECAELSPQKFQVSDGAIFPSTITVWLR